MTELPPDAELRAMDPYGTFLAVDADTVCEDDILHTLLEDSMGLQSPTPSVAASEMSIASASLASSASPHVAQNLDGCRLEIVRHGIHKVEKDPLTGQVEHVASNAKKFDLDVAVVDAQGRTQTRLSGMYLRVRLLFENGCEVEPLKGEEDNEVLLGGSEAMVINGQAAFKALTLGKHSLTTRRARQRFRLAVGAPAHPELATLSPPFKSVTKLERRSPDERPTPLQPADDTAFFLQDTYSAPPSAAALAAAARAAAAAAQQQQQATPAATATPAAAWAAAKAAVAPAAADDADSDNIGHSAAGKCGYVVKTEDVKATVNLLGVDLLATGETGAPTAAAPEPEASDVARVAAMAAELATASGERAAVAQRLQRQDDQIEELKRSNHAILQELLALRRQLTAVEGDERSVTKRSKDCD